MLLVMAFVGGNSCKTAKPTTQVVPQQETISSNLKVTFRKDSYASGITLDGQLRLVKDKAIQVSMRMPIFGTEVAKVVITPAHVLIIDRLHKTFVYEVVSEVQEKLTIDLDYNSLEAEFSQPKDDISFNIHDSEFDVRFLNFEKNKDFTIDDTPPNPEKYTQVALDQLIELIKRSL